MPAGPAENPDRMRESKIRSVFLLVIFFKILYTISCIFKKGAG